MEQDPTPAAKVPAVPGIAEIAESYMRESSKTAIQRSPDRGAQGAQTSEEASPGSAVAKDRHSDRDCSRGQQLRSFSN